MSARHTEETAKRNSIKQKLNDHRPLPQLVRQALLLTFGIIAVLDPHAHIPEKSSVCLSSLLCPWIVKELGKEKGEKDQVPRRPLSFLACNSYHHHGMPLWKAGAQ